MMRARSRGERWRQRVAADPPNGGDRGCSLVEAVIALTLVCVTVTGIAPVLLVAVRAVDAARAEAATRCLAASRLEQLRALTFVWRDVSGASEPFSDSETDLALDPAERDGPGLIASGPDVLFSDTPGRSDVLDAHGNVLPGPSGSAAGAYLRRWSVEPAAFPSEHLIIVRALAATAASERGGGPRWNDGWRRDDGWVATARARWRP